MSLLPCGRDPAPLRVIEDDGWHWNLDALREHVRECRHCASLQRAFAAMAGAQGGSKARGARKRRGDAAYYRALAVQGWHAWKKAQGVAFPRLDSSSPLK